MKFQDIPFECFNSAGRSFFARKMNYIYNSPVKAGLVANHGSYLYSSAATISEKKGLLKCICVVVGSGSQIRS